MSYQSICRLVSLSRYLTLAMLISIVLAVGAKAQTPQDAPKDEPVTRVSRTYPDKAPDDPFKARLIPRDSKVYIAPMLSEDPKESQSQGFETYLAAALRKKNVPLLIVADQAQADFIIEGTADKKAAGLAKKILLGDFRKSTSASMSVTNLRTGVVAYADSSDKSSANRGLRSSAEKLAKYLKKKIEDDEKKH
jgi:hypothetical protein